MSNQVEATILTPMLGATIKSFFQSADILQLFAEDGRTFTFDHMQECCECVHIEDVAGDLNDLIGSPILQAEEVTNDAPDCSEAGTWTFYKFATVKGSVTVRWLGESNGYYSEGVSFIVTDATVAA